MRRTLAWYFLQGEAETITFRRNGNQWSAFVWDVGVSAKLFLTGGHQLHELQAVLGWLHVHGYLTDDRSVIFDVGANIGTASVQLAQETGRRIVAVEPISANFQLLQQNVLDNGLTDHVTCVRAAVADRSGQAQIVAHAAGKIDNSGLAELWTEDTRSTFELEAETTTLTQVPTITLDNLLQTEGIQANEVAMVWSDTQGSESLVIESGSSLWAARVPLFVEVWPDGLRAHGGLDRFLLNVSRSFDAVVFRDDLVRLGSGAQARPVAELAEILQSPTFSSSDNSGATDVLLLPLSS